MDYNVKLKYHFRPKKGWINDPNGLVYYKGYYHIFYQHSPNYEGPWKEAICWGHARTKDFINFEELPIALKPDKWYDAKGCWSGTAIVKGDILYLFYASIYKQEGVEEWIETISVAYSVDGINFQKYQDNPIIPSYPSDGSHDFRDPSIMEKDGIYYLIIASGHIDSHTARLLTYKSNDLFHFKYQGIMYSWDNSKCAECPSFMPYGNDKFLLTVSVCKLNNEHYFQAMIGSFDGIKFIEEYRNVIDIGPDQYAGQTFLDSLGRHILITWIPGWQYANYQNHDIGCMSIPRKIILQNNKIIGQPLKEIMALLKNDDEAIIYTDDGFKVNRTNREPFIYHGKINNLKVLKDGYVLEIFINDGQEIVSILL